MPVARLTAQAPPMPMATPIRPPMMQMTSVSSRNCARMARWFAQIPVPASRVRSIADTGRIFIIPLLLRAVQRNQENYKAIA